MTILLSIILVIALAGCAVTLGAGSGDGSKYNFMGFSFNGFTLGADIETIDLSKLNERAPLNVKNSYAYNYDNVRFDTDDSGRITRFYLTVGADDVYMSVTYVNGNSGIGYSAVRGAEDLHTESWRQSSKSSNHSVEKAEKAGRTGNNN